MAKLLVALVLVIFGVALSCTATMYNVGGSSGWDISTDLDTWAKDTNFQVGDVLAFQYSSYHSVSEVNRRSFAGCNTTNVLQTSSNGNTTIPLTSPGDRYFICGNRLHCLGGMKLHVHVDGSLAPADAPQADSSKTAFPPPTSKSNNPSTVVPSSAVFIDVGIDSVLMVILGCIGSVWMI